MQVKQLLDLIQEEIAKIPKGKLAVPESKDDPKNRCPKDVIDSKDKTGEDQGKK